MVKVGITGQNGFIGQHIYHTLGLFPDEFERIDFERAWFDDEQQLNAFIAKCDVVIHLAAINRHNDANVIYNTNVGLVKKITKALIDAKSNAHVLFSSSSQEENDNLYGQSKKDGRMLFAEWANNFGGTFTGLVIPNVFGPFGKPYYNSFVATFCHQLTHNEHPKIDIDSPVKLIYVAELVSFILSAIRNKTNDQLIIVPHTSTHFVSEILILLKKYKNEYFDLGIIPELNNSFELNLFNTFRGFIDIGSHFPVKFTQHTDARGAFVEIIKLNQGGQISFSTTVSGVTRGNHYHTRKIERFAVIKGKALIQLRMIGTNSIVNFHLSGDEPAYVDMPIWYTHNIKNTGTDDLYTIFWINEFFDPTDADTYFETV